MARSRSARTSLHLTLCTAAVIGCGRGTTGSSQDTLMVSAASSLREVVTTATRSFAADARGIDVQLNFGGSGALRQQIEQGAPVDVFLSASPEHIDRLVEKGRIAAGERRVLARNRLVLIGDRTKIATLEDLLSGAVVRFSIGDPRSVPAGGYARQWLQAEGIWDGIESKTVLGGDVRQVLDYVKRGEVDGGIVYATDATLLDIEPILTASGPEAPDVVYEAALVESTERPSRAARRFFEYLKGGSVREILEDAGFIAP